MPIKDMFVPRRRRLLRIVAMRAVTFHRARAHCPREGCLCPEHAQRDDRSVRDVAQEGLPCDVHGARRTNEHLRKSRSPLQRGSPRQPAMIISEILLVSMEPSCLQGSGVEAPGLGTTCSASHFTRASGTSGRPAAAREWTSARHGSVCEPISTSSDDRAEKTAHEGIIDFGFGLLPTQLILPHVSHSLGATFGAPGRELRGGNAQGGAKDVWGRKLRWLPGQGHGGQGESWNPNRTSPYGRTIACGSPPINTGEDVAKTHRPRQTVRPENSSLKGPRGAQINRHK